MSKGSIKAINPRVAIMREAIGKIVSMLTTRKIEVTCRGHKAFVTYSDRTGEPKRVNLPYMPDDASNELLDAIQGFIDHEIGHIFFTDYKVLLKARSLGVANLHNVIEDTYVEREMKKKFTGSAHNIGTTTTFFLKNYTDKELAKDPSKAVGLLMVPAIRAWSGQREAHEYMTAEKWEVVKEVTAKLGSLVERLPGIKNSQDALDLALEFREAMRPKEEPKKEEPPEPPEPEKPEPEATGGKGETPEEFGEGPSDRETEETEDTGDFSDGPDDREIDEEHSDPSDREDPDDAAGDDDGAEPDAGDGTLDLKDAGAGEETDDDAGDKADTSSAEPGGELGGDDGIAGEGDHEFESDDDEAYREEEEEDRYLPPKPDDPFKDIPDFDDGLSEAITEEARKVSKETDYLIWSKDFDKVEKFVLRSPEAKLEPLVKEMSDRVDHMVGTMQKDLERAIAARSRSVWRSGLRRGRINASALARLTVGDDRVFRKREISTSKDVAVSLLVDCSGSMNGGRIQTASLASYALSATLDRMNITHEVLGFTTRGDLPFEADRESAEIGVRYGRTEMIYMPIFKEFAERMTPDVKRRIAAFPRDLYLSQNVDGECVEIAAQRLLRREETRKIMIVLSDGAPCCPGDMAAQANHLKKIVNTVTKAGVDVVGVGIQTESVKRFYPKSVVLNDVSELSGQVIKQLRALLLAD
jgi:cobaltochelatase CobT